MLQLDTVGLNNDEKYSKNETQFIRCHLHDAEAEIHRLDQKRHQLTLDIRRYTVAIAPHKWLPEDVIRCIFACLVDDSAIRFPFKNGHAPPQVVLSHVCSSWRRIVLDMKSAWSRITVVPQENFSAFCETWSPRILLRLSVDLASSTLSTTKLEGFWSSFSHFRFKEMEFIMDDNQLRYCVDEPGFDDISLEVERVGLVMKPCYAIQHLPKFLSRPLYSFKAISHPQRCGSGWPIENSTLPWAQLRCLDLGSSSFHSKFPQIIESLRQCTALEVCSLGLRPPVTEMPTEQVTLPVLQKFTITVPNLHALSHFLLPSLRILEIRNGTWTYDLRELLQRQLNFHQLHELNIARIKGSPSVISILKDVPMLRRLCLSPESMFDENCLCYLGNGRLGQHLEFLQLYSHSCTVDDLRKMVEARLEIRKILPGIAPRFHVQFTHKTGAAPSRFLAVNNDMRIELCYINNK